jgi:phage FluMu protein Com
MKAKRCKHKNKLWSRGQFSFLNCLKCGKLLRKVYTPEFDYETDNAFIRG